MSGEVLYSGVSTLQSGDIYLLGHNPGGDPTNPRLPTVGSSLEELPSKTINSYLDTQWSGGDTLQRRVLWLLRKLGYHPREVAASNLIFPRSRDEAGSQFGRFAELCWPVHEQILQIVQPHLIVVYGNSPFSFLLQKYGAARTETFPSGHGDWMCRRFEVPGRFVLVGLPHLSRYDITRHSRVIDWIKQSVEPRDSRTGRSRHQPDPMHGVARVSTAGPPLRGYVPPWDLIHVVCPHCLSSWRKALEPWRHTLRCGNCQNAFEVQVTRVKALETAAPDVGRRWIRVRVEHDEGPEEPFEFPVSEASVFDLRGGEVAVFTSIGGTAVLVQNAAGAYVKVAPMPEQPPSRASQGFRAWFRRAWSKVRTAD